MKIEYDEVEDLAIHLLSMKSEEDHSVIEEELHQTFGISFDDFHNLIEHLVPLIKIELNLGNGTLYKGFSSKSDWLIKI